VIVVEGPSGLYIRVEVPALWQWIIFAVGLGNLTTYDNFAGHLETRFTVY
jgi:hypothetical protein